MARVTVEDCLDRVENRFELVMVASKRARQLTVGGRESSLVPENDKATVIALREVAEGITTAEILDEVDVLEAPEPAFGFDEPQHYSRPAFPDSFS